MKNTKKNINNILDGDFVVKDLFRKNRLLLVIIFSVSLFLIWNNHRTENTVRKINRYNREIEELRYTHLSTTNELTSVSRPSSVAGILKETGISESKIPPIRIIEQE
jgi:cell division protein FtsL